MRFSRFSLALAASFAAGCLSEPGNEPETARGALYRCIGLPGYTEGAVQEILAELKANPPDCRDGAALPRLGRSMNVSDTASDSVSVHLIVMDEQCDLIKETRSTIADSGANLSFHWLFDGLDGMGNPLPSGEYFMNAEVTRGAARDTSYQKIGWIRDPCAP